MNKIVLRLKKISFCFPNYAIKFTINRVYVYITRNSEYQY